MGGNDRRLERKEFKSNSYGAITDNAADKNKMEPVDSNIKNRGATWGVVL